jgi:hypothetical protein
MVETSELLQALNARGQLLLAGDAEPDDGRTDRGLTLLALERLLMLATAAETAAAGHPGAFKAKSNRW